MTPTVPASATPFLPLEALASAGAGGVMDLEWRLTDARTWDATVSGFDGVCQEQLVCYAERRWPRVGLEPILYFDKGIPVAGVLVMLQRLPLGVATIALTKWGPILADNQSPQAEALMARVVDSLVGEYADKRGMMISILPKVEPGPGNLTYDALIARGFAPGIGTRVPDRYVVDLMLDPERRMAALGQKWRYHLRKSFKAGLAFEHGNAADLTRFMALYQTMSDRKRFPDHSAIDSVDALLSLPETMARPEIFFANHDGKTVGGAIVFTAGDTAAYLFGATDNAALELRAGYFLHWQIIEWLRTNSAARYYDLGGSDGFQGLHQFKSGLVGCGGYIAPLPPAANYARQRHVLWLGDMAYRARDKVNRMRDKLLELKLARSAHAHSRPET